MLYGAKVTLRSLEREDLPTIWELRNDAELESLVHGAPVPRSLAQIERDFDIALEGDGGPLKFVVELDDTVIGRCDLFGLDGLARSCRIGITLGREHWGRGYGRDTVSVLIRYAFRDHNMNRVWLEVLADNERAIRAYRACGLVEEGRLREHTWHDGAYKDIVVMGVLRSEWLAAQHE
jgi:RimJ/RimL family protein N-acetyltransferase